MKSTRHIPDQMSETLSLYPLRFQPLFRRYIWGGRRLATELDKPIGEGDDYAESWEIVDHGKDQSVVAAGPLQGKKLEELIQHYGAELIGKKVAMEIEADSVPSNLRNRFPLLLKILDANRDLSVQVHPNDTQARLLDPPDLGKTEAWIVLATEPGSKIYAGLKLGIGKTDFIRAIEENEVEQTLHAFEPAVGDAVFIPAGTMHAIGAGLLIAEIQQSSDTTFRVFDWNRTDAAGNSRELHIDSAIEVTDFEAGPAKVVSASEGQMQKLIQCDKFSVIRHIIENDLTLPMSECFQIIVVTKGEILVEGDPASRPLVIGESMLIPACLDQLKISTSTSSEILVASR